MNRTIKFRAWDGKQMHEEVHAVNGMAYVDSEVKYDTPHKEVYPIENSTIMQFTGLLDKNRKEGYEGDVIERDSPFSKSKKVRGVITFSKSAFRIDWLVKRSGNWNDVLHLHLPESEIIGNIYENPELLK